MKLHLRVATIVLLAFSCLASVTGCAGELSDRDAAFKSMALMKRVAAAIGVFALDHDRYPEADNIGELARLIEDYNGLYVPQDDGWDRPFLLQSSAETYELRSLGSDGERDEGEPAGEADSWEADIVYSDAEFVQWPKELEAMRHE